MRSDAGRAARSASLRISASERVDAWLAVGEESGGEAGVDMGVLGGSGSPHFAPTPHFPGFLGPIAPGKPPFRAFGRAIPTGLPPDIPRQCRSKPRWLDCIA